MYKYLIIAFIGLFSIVVHAKGLQLSFKIDENFLICHTLTKEFKKASTPTVDNFRKELLQNFPQEIQFLRNLSDLTPTTLQKEQERLKNLLNNAKSSSSYSSLLMEAHAHLKDVQSEWEENLSRTLQFMTSQTGITFDKNIEVYVTHPEVYQGRFLDKNTIAWGRKADWKNYATVYLWHEIMHTYLQFNDRSHALIELMTDDALKIFMNGGFYPPFSDSGHSRLLKIKQAIYTKYWKQYLVSPNKNIHQLEDLILQDKQF